ncbi:related to AIM1-cytoplasmic protein involved in mitochondrial function or organization [Sporisorium reilianum f. sp. reilianum]|uniref:Related to AIM1-cytoplasmic protein involved in mitochondrial function or organization n=1 Tax=Sporisorium reilianum f. sp. reilianum TaxID=72559 RepID=A0A2N8UP80_9BASI|nr:related to AIM1-cytoplasmic protein involved in mitochondrial function or organization [Sporisorium reilianum f. sp. reilianum]
MLGSITAAARTTALRRTPVATALPLRSLSTTRILSNSSSSSTAQEQQEVTAGEQKIRDILTAKFKPSILKVQDVSGGCGSFYAIQLSSKEFKGLSTVKAHRLVNEQLKDVIKDIHGLQLRTVAED